MSSADYETLRMDQPEKQAFWLALLQGEQEEQKKHAEKTAKEMRRKGKRGKR